MVAAALRAHGVVDVTEHDAAGVSVDRVVGDVVADVAAYPPPQALDLVVVAYLHVAQARLHAALRRAAGALAPGGDLVVLGWDRSTDAGPPAELRHDPGEIVAALAIPRTEVVRAERVAQVGSDTARDALIRVRRTAAS